MGRWQGDSWMDHLSPRLDLTMLTTESSLSFQTPQMMESSLQKMPSPWNLSSLKVPSYLSPFSKNCVPLPSNMPLCQLPSYSLWPPSLQRTPQPLWTPSLNSPSYQLPSLHQKVPRPLRLPALNSPSQTLLSLPVQLQMPLPSFLSNLNSPRQQSPVAKQSSPCPSSWPLWNSPYMILWVLLKKQMPLPCGRSTLVSPMQTISAFSKNLGPLKEGSTPRTTGELFLTVSSSFILSSIARSSRPMKPVSQLRSSRQNCVFSSIFSSEDSSISSLLLILPMRRLRVLFISSMDLNLQVLICYREFSVKRTDSFSLCSSFFLLMQLLMIELQLSWKSVRIFSSYQYDSSMRRIKSESSSFLKSLLKALRQCSMNLLISMESWFLWEPWMVRQMEQISPRSLQLLSMQTKVGFWPWEWQLQGLMKSRKLLENCCTSTQTLDIYPLINMAEVSFKLVLGGQSNKWTVGTGGRQEAGYEGGLFTR